MAKQTKLSEPVDEMLTKLSKKRKGDGSLINTKQSIVAELIQKQFKKECK